MLRAGRGNPLFLLSGGGADVHELDPLVATLRSPRPLVAVPYWEAGKDGRLPTTVEAMADGALEMILASQPKGPYSLVGYSLGGVVALEVARRLLDRGESVRPPILIDSLTHKSAWTLPLFVRVGVRYLLHHALARTRAAAVETVDSYPAVADGAATRCSRALELYRPAPYPGPVTLLHAVDEPYLGGIAPTIWRKLALRVTSFPIAARHLDLMRVERIVAEQARIIEKLLDNEASESASRHALVATGVSWGATARLAQALATVGFTVEAVAPAGHPLTRLECLVNVHKLGWFDPLRSVERAIMESRPDVVIPTDDFVTDLLHRLHSVTQDGGVRALIERSLGNPALYGRKFDRRWMAEAAVGLGISTPRTVHVRRKADLPAQLGQIGIPAFLKVDGSWGGLGVAKIHDLRDARRAWRRLSRLRVVRAVKRALFNGDVSGIGRLRHRERPVFSLQEAVDGDLVIVSAVCHRGELLGMLSARVLSQQGAFGPATIIQMDDRLPVRDPVGKIIRYLDLSGLCGFDFILSANGDPCFIELNPRATQTSDFIGERDGDLLAALLDSLGGRGTARNGTLRNGMIVTISRVTASGSASHGATCEAPVPSSSFAASPLRDDSMATPGLVSRSAPAGADVQN